MIDPKESLGQAIARAIEQEAEALKEKAVQAAVEAFESDLRQAVGKKAVDVSRYYEISRNADNLVITVKHHP